MAEQGETLTAKDLAKQGKAETPDVQEPKGTDWQMEYMKLKAQLELKPEKERTPGLRVVDEEGNTQRKKRVNSYGITDLMMPPYTKKVVAIYKIRSHDEINPATGLKSEPVDVSIPGRYVFFDRMEADPLKKHKILANVTGVEHYNENGEAKTRETVEDILFNSGFKTVSVDQDYALYVFMELHPMNASNKYRPRNAPAVFERLDVRHKSKASIAAEQDLVLDAGNAVRLMDKEELYKYAVPAMVDTSAGRQVQEIRTDLKTWAMKHPIDFFKLNKDHTAAVRINVMDCMALGLIDYLMDKKTFLISTTEEKIMTHTAHEEPQERLINFLAKKENEALYNKLLDQLNYWNNE